jgi:ADP-ribose pyrophosphatase YjhB (NUDIX family)
VIDIVNAVLLRQPRVLLARRSMARRAYPGLWSFPGGHVEATRLSGLALESYRPIFAGLASGG